MRKSYKYQLKPNKTQTKILEINLFLCHNLYNAAIEQRLYAWKARKVSLSWMTQINQLPEMKEENPEYGLVYAQSLQDVIKRVDKAYDGFFGRIKRGETPGYPRFKSYDRYDSFTYPQISSSRVKIEEKHVILPKIGKIRCNLHRKIEGTPKTATIKREGKRWFIVFSCDNVPIKELPKTNKIVGIDLGVESLCTFSDGTVIENPRWYRNTEPKLRDVQRKYSLKKSNAKREKLSRLHRKVKNQRYDFIHKVSRRIINENDTVVIEKLEPQKMASGNKHGLNKSIRDAAWGLLVACLLYKAEEAGSSRHVIQVNPRNTSKTCSACGYIKEDLKLSDRVYVCDACGHRENRDLNAAKNILALGASAASGRISVG